MIATWVQGAAGPDAFNGASFIAPLDTTIVLTRGDGPPTHSRASVATVFDWEGLLKSVLSGEARFYGARRVQNLVSTTSEDFSNAAWQVSGATKVGATVIDGVPCMEISMSAGANNALFQAVLHGVTGRYAIRTLLRAKTAPVTLRLGFGASGPGDYSGDITVPVAWTLIGGTSTTDLSSGNNFSIRNSIAGTAMSFYIANYQFEDVTGQSNQNPGNYVSVGVLSTPFQGAGVDGVQYFAYQNGNTVASNVVTEATGAAIASATLRGLWREAAGTQLVTPTASIRDMTNAAWAKTTMTTAKTSTGIDGVANSATRLTASAGNALAIQTLVAAATSRTYSCFIRRVTGTGNIELTQDGTTFTNIAGSLNSTTYTRVQLNASQLNATFGIRIVTNGDAIDVDFNQFEAGAYATSPMAAAGAARAADNLTFPITNVDALQGWCYAEIQLDGFAAGSTPVAIGTNNVGAGGIALYSGTATDARITDGTGAATKAGLTDTTTGIRKRASRWGTLMAVTGDGAAVASAAFDGDMSLGASLGIGGQTNGGNALGGTIKNARIGKQLVTDAQLQAFPA